MKAKGLSGHERTTGEELWLTPPALLHALGAFDLDPCACPEPRPWRTASEHIALPEDGLSVRWKGRIWCNPPYGEKSAAWLERMAAHQRGTALIFARTETEAWQKFIWPYASALLFIQGRLTFHLPDGSRAGANAGAPSVLVAFGYEDADILLHSGVRGAFVDRAQVAMAFSPLPQQGELLCSQQP